MPPSKVRRIVPALLQWFAAHARDLPWRRTLDPYAIWVSEIMLQQTQVKTVIPYWERWMSELPSIADLARARPEKVLKLWEGLGYYTRVRNLQTAARKISSEPGGCFPTQFNEILALSGVGRYTAGAIASIAFNQPAPILDGNVIRVLTRLFAIDADPKQKQTNTQLWAIAEQLVREAAQHSPPPTPHPFTLSGACSALNQSLMELGATVCTPRQARCADCPLRSHCAARATNRVDSLPNLARRNAVTPRRFVAFVVERDGRWLVRQRSAGVLNAHLWEFPNAEIDNGATDVNEVASGVLRARLRSLRRLTTVKHSITRYRISLEAYLFTGGRIFERSKDARWLALAELEKLPFTSAHRKVLAALRGSIAQGVRN
jgi:A/G-specific adenine glycosylase